MNDTMGQAPPHHMGIVQVLRHCGPETFQDEYLLALYRSCRALLICQAFCRQRRCLLIDDEAWKSVPWQRVPKTFEDRLMDFFVESAGIAEDVVVPENREACRGRITTLSKELERWRWDWHATNWASVRKAPQESSEKGVDLEFDSPRLALDILYYNAALLYLMQLETAAGGQMLPSSDEVYFGRRHMQALESRGNPLLLPDEVKFRCQPAIEALMTILCLNKLLAATPKNETVVPPAPIGIVYWVLRDHQHLGGRVASLLSTHPIFDDGERIFVGYFVSVAAPPVTTVGPADVN
ncbi:hypothetical protein N0V88_006835 [Collariella sp. IMI 366227]|nr:hypothetical protein N0V88_006835 [Collariella sp. IMI 366227]